MLSPNRFTSSEADISHLISIPPGFPRTISVIRLVDSVLHIFKVVEQISYFKDEESDREVFGGYTKLMA
jgi:hypothetical protein